MGTTALARNNREQLPEEAQQHRVLELQAAQ